ncbi:fibronectin-like protein [Leifsonia xyli subsp. cynodontis DSM 46306]|uniref:Uncharacterized protein n=1 Tax=Leifsonia xyli subsp. cynodontis DSM 46306 TaxID=1389489 RepID=U3P456_LEIXC|nr:hypothetical protein [Leifsonia xyli]AGW40531.1 fibronectin-like protein [Leifsonia xyli subsp. cynodontis DSM 46306]
MARHLAGTGGPAHRRHGLLSLAAAGVLSLIALPIGATWAAFTDGSAATTRQSGTVDIAQDSAGSQQYSDRAQPHLIVPAKTGAAQPIASLSSKPSGSPSVATASFPVSVYLLSGYRDVALRATVYDTGSSPVFPWLLFDIQAEGKSTLPGGTPLSAEAIAALDSGAGAALPVPAAGKATTVTVKAWLAPNSPPLAFRASVAPGVAVSAETIGGKSFTVKEKLG